MTATVLLGTSGLILGGGWLGVQLILNPASLSWLSHLLPIKTFAASEPQTLEQINAEIRQAGQIPGQALYLSTYPGLTQQQLGFHDVLLPIARQSKSCDAMSNCKQIVELRIYRSGLQREFPGKGILYELIDRMAVQGPEEMAVIAPLTDASAITQGSTRTLPLTELRWIDGKSPTGIWFQLNGEWKRGSLVLYGQIFHYSPEQGRLNLLQTWSSVAGQFPQWRQVTGNAISELVVNQSIGLEPQFQVFQVRSNRSLVQPLTLEPINLTETALEDRPYQNALILARHGLWSPALALLKPFKQTLRQQSHWSATAQAQMDLIALHASVTQIQADRNWASPTQQVLAQVMDGRWSKAFNLLQSAHRSGYDVKNLLSSNADRLWQRVEAAVRVNPRQTELQQWGALVLTVKQNRDQALVWLHKQPQLGKDKQAIASVQQTLALLEAPPSSVSPPQPLTARAEATAEATAEHSTIKLALTDLIGSVKPIDPLPPQAWIAPQPELLTRSPQQHWYQIKILSLENQSDWQTAIANYQTQLNRDPQQAQALWQQLGLAGASLQIVIWQGIKPFSLTAEIKAVQLKHNTLSLLAIGDALPEPIDSLTAGIAITPDSVSWAPVIATQTLQELDQQHPDWQQTLWPQLWQKLQTAQLVAQGLNSANPLETIGSWSAQQMELTGDQFPETVLTIEARPDDPKPHTLIFSEQGQMLYSDLETDRSLVTIADRTNHPLPVLITTTDRGLELQQWSTEHQRFE